MKHNLYEFKDDALRLEALKSRDQRLKVAAIATAISSALAGLFAALAKYLQ